jgi:transposase
VLSVEDWAGIRRLRRAEKMSISEIARVLGISRNMVRGALGSDSPPKYEREPAGSIEPPRSFRRLHLVRGRWSCGTWRK